MSAALERRYLHPAARLSHHLPRAARRRAAPHFLFGSSIITIIAMLSVWFARPNLLTVFLPIAAVADVTSARMSSLHADLTGPSFHVILFALVAVVARGTVRMPRLWLVFFAVAALHYVLRHAAGVPREANAWLLLGIGVAALLWTLVDARPALGLVTWLVIEAINETCASLFSPRGTFVPLSTPLLLLAFAMVLGVPAIWRLRRQALL